jgi:lactate dehydrogenase-like 2-hydroxyacid dehydrogenase
MLMDPIGDQVLSTPGLRCVSNVAVGFDNIDLGAATTHGVMVTNTPGILDETTADFAFTLLMAAARRVIQADHFVRDGHFKGWAIDMMLGQDVNHATLGIVGIGRIGRAVARRARGFGLRLLATPTRSPVPDEDRAGVTFVELPELLAGSDVVTLHCPLTPETRHLVDDAALARMRPSALLVNTARGAVVDTDALVRALREGRLAGAALDVFEDEPDVDPRLLALEQVVLTPHLGSAGDRTRSAMCLLAVRNVAAVLAGRPPLTPV